MNTLKARMHEVVTELADRGVDQVALAKAAGVSKGTVTHWLNGTVQSIKLEYALGIENAYGYSAIWLVLGKGRKRADAAQEIETQENPALVSIRKIHFRLSAGIAGFKVEYLENGDSAPLFLPREWVDKRGYDPAKLYATRVSGHSMEPTIKDQDTTVINTGDTRREDGEVYAFNFDGEFTVKRLFKDLRRWWLRSDNSDQRRYPPRECDDHTFLIGRVVLNQTETF